MIQFLYNLHLKHTKNLAGNWYPIPTWLKLYLKTLPYNQQRVTVARLFKDKDLSTIAVDEYGCMESISRIDNALFGEPIMTGTNTALQYYLKSPKWKRIPFPVKGCTILYATGTGLRGTVGHVMIYDHVTCLWSNNSIRKVFDNHFTLTKARELYSIRQHMPEYCFIYKG
ncbi:TPA: hypothetical protein DEP58_01695 [Patescibacteria group bacterium]|nr:hypothetical protein [Patescibacteria group bacterium]